MNPALNELLAQYSMAWLKLAISKTLKINSCTIGVIPGEQLIRHAMWFKHFTFCWPSLLKSYKFQATHILD